MATGGSRKIDITALGPAAVDTVLWQMQGRLHVTIVAKASFSFVPDAAMARIDADEILRAEVHHNKNPMRSVRSTGDLAPFQPLCDVVLTGHACAPAGTMVDALSVRLVVFREVPLIDKTLYVRGDTQNGEATPFERIPLMYERAFGGIGWEDNPLGVGAGAATSAKTPNVLDPEDPKRVAGFAPISRGWPLRKRLLGTADRKALDRPIAEIPAGFDWAYYQSAPLDQRAEYLHGSEWIILDGMNPAHGHIQSYLPGARAFARVYGVADGGSGHLLTLSADTLRIDADALTCSITWRASFPVQAEEALAALRIVAGVESAGHPLEWPALPAPPPPSIAPLPVERPTEVLSLGAILPPRGASTMMLQDEPEPARKPSPALGKLPPTIEIVEAPAEAKVEAKVEVPEPPAEIAEVSVEILEVIEDVTDLARSIDSIEIIEEPSSAPAWASTMAMGPGDEGEAARAPAIPFLHVSPEQAAALQQASPSTMRLPPSIDENPSTQSFVSTLFIDDQEDRTLRRPLPFSPPIAPETPAPAPPAAPVAAPVREEPAPAPPIAEPATEPDPAPEPLRARPAAARPRLGAIEIVNDTALALAAVPWGMTPSRDCFTVIAKATCNIVPGGRAVVRAVADPLEGDRFGEGDTSSCAHPSDFALFKVRADVVLTGHACAPAGAVTSMKTRFAFGAEGNSFDRSILVFGDRRWEPGPVAQTPSAPEPFLRMPLVHGRAYGGKKYDANPVGIGYPDRTRRGPAPLPNLEDPGRLLRTPNQIVPPACFAPIALGWKEVTAGRGSRRSVWPCFPEELDWTLYQAAPPAQQLAFLRGDEAFTLTGMRKERPVLTGSLPGIRARAFRTRRGDSAEISLHLDTVVFDLDAMKIQLLWRGTVPVSDERSPDLDALHLITESAALDPTPIDVQRDSHGRR